MEQQKKDEKVSRRDSESSEVSWIISIYVTTNNDPWMRDEKLVSASVLASSLSVRPFEGCSIYKLNEIS